jgi:hypothetical protein
MTRKTAKDYRKDRNDLQNKVKALESRISERLLTLCNLFPDATVAKMQDTDIKAKTIGDINYIVSLDIDVQIQYIENIEKYIADMNPIKQSEIDFNENK